MVLIGTRLGLGFGLRDENEVVVYVVYYDGDCGADDDGEEGCAHLAEIEIVDVYVDEGEGFEEGVVDGVNEGGVDVYEENGRVQEGDFDWG